MLDRIEKKLSNIVKYQFPSLYRDEDDNLFISFVEAYYEWLEQEHNILHESRNFLENRDIDETVENFLIFFQKKYLYGIPFDVIINKTYLLKHVLDVYRTKGTIKCYKLLFKLIYDEEIDVYLPGRDMLRSSDGTWKEPKYIEISYSQNAAELVGKTIIGMVSGITAIVESYVNEAINGNIITILYLSNILPKGGNFRIGEKIINNSDIDSDDLINIVSDAPSIIGSLDHIEFLNGGLSFIVGDMLKIAQRDIVTDNIISNGIDGIVRVTEIGPARGILDFNIINPGSGYMANASTFVYNNANDVTGNGGSFSLGTLLSTQSIEFNSDIIGAFADKQLDETSYGLPEDSAANATSTLQSSLTYNTGVFGGILSLTNINRGNNYTYPPNVFIRSTHSSMPMEGTVSFDSGTANVTGTGTEFTRFLSNNVLIGLQSNTSDVSTLEMSLIKEVVNNTLLILYGVPNSNSVSDSIYKMSPDILESNFAYYQDELIGPEFTISGLNANVYASGGIGNGSIKTAIALNSGRGYVDNETVTLYLYGAIDTPSIITGGENYTNGDILVCAGGEALTPAQGYITTDANGVITDVSLTYYGAGYVTEPTIIVKSDTGTGAHLTTVLVEFNPLYEVSGLVKKGGIGKRMGYWDTTRGFLNSDKYLQDSYFYQDFSYQIKAATSFNKYRDILYNTFHIAGTELFGQYLIVDIVSLNISATMDANVVISTIETEPSLDHTNYENSQYIGLGV